MARRKPLPPRAPTPFLAGINLASRLGEEGGDEFPFSIPALRGGLNLNFTSMVTFLVGENGSGKSTLLEALAFKLGYDQQGGSRDHQFSEKFDNPPPLARALHLHWAPGPRMTDGFFLRAESFFNFANYIHEVGGSRYGIRNLHEQSHGESFLALFENRFESGIFLLDEPEAALSPARQLTFLAILHSLARSGQAQLIIATHSPILLTLPGATVLQIDDAGITSVDYRETEHYRLSRDFLTNPERYFRHLLAEEEPQGDLF